jgi:hypothetical protein
MSVEKQNPLSEAYLRFLQLAKAFQFDNEDVEMDANERALLDALALCWYEGQPMTVREAISLEHLGSPATLHKRITRLRQKELLIAFNQEGDRRAKYLIPSEKTLDFYGYLGQNLQKVQSPVNE